MWLRAGVPADSQDLFSLQRSASLVGFRHIFPPERFPFPDQQVAAQCWRILNDPAHHVLIGVGDDDDLVGFVSYHDDRVDHLFVEPKYWRHGFGARLLAAAADGIRIAGNDTARLWVLEDNRLARGLYEQRGWRLDGTSQQIAFPPHPTEVGYALTVGSAATPPTSGSTDDPVAGQETPPARTDPPRD